MGPVPVDRNPAGQTKTTVASRPSPIPGRFDSRLYSHPHGGISCRQLRAVRRCRPTSAARLRMETRGGRVGSRGVLATSGRTDHLTAATSRDIGAHMASSPRFEFLAVRLRDCARTPGRHRCRQRVDLLACRDNNGRRRLVDMVAGSRSEIDSSDERSTATRCPTRDSILTRQNKRLTSVRQIASQQLLAAGLWSLRFLRQAKYSLPNDVSLDLCSSAPDGL